VKIQGLQKTSLIDYPGKIACVVFTYGCNFACPFCHNPQLVSGKPGLQITSGEFFKFLNQRRGLLEGVVITGGEPTLHSDLCEFIINIKNLGFAIKLDTNGAKPQLLAKIIKKHLVDYIAMDIKASVENYNKSAGVDVDIDKILQSIKLIINSNIEHEFRSTLVPGLHNESEVKKMAQMIKHADKWILQEFDNHKTLDPNFEKIKPFASLKKFVKIGNKFIKTKTRE